MLVVCFVFTMEMFFRLTFFYLGLIDFTPGVFLQVFGIVMNYSLYFTLLPMSYHFRFGINAAILITCNIISYFCIKERRRAFFYYLSMKNKYDWFKSVIDNMNSGFMSIETTDIQYCNNTMMKLFASHEDPTQDILLKDVFVSIQSEAYSINCFWDVVQVLSQNYTMGGDGFLFLGTKSVTSSKGVTNLEVFGRCYSSCHSTIDKFEFIFNDVTRSKQIEEKNAEFKYKNLFLSKVAHEFKNPLLCICELVDQISEGINSPEVKVADILKQIKSMSNYLIILVKDLDYFSQKNTGIIKSAVEMGDVEVDELLKFCKDIISGLIKKSQKENNLTFDIIREESFPRYVYSDEIKLKQILVNLLSNSVKYTQSGQITLRLSLQDNNVMFRINDTGKGISEEQKEKLFIPFSNEYDKLNKVSSGLGLSIVKELTELLGSRIEFDSNVGKGSSFWFKIPSGSLTGDNSGICHSVSTINGIHYNDTGLEVYLGGVEVSSKGSATQELPDKPSKSVLVMIVDDEIITRQSTVRLLSKYLKERSYDATIVEASDGIECLYKYQLLYKEGKVIDFILSDETMEFMNGGICAENLKNLYLIKNFSQVPFYILSAYETLSFSHSVGITGVYTKPMRKQNFDEILNNVLYKLK
jgi:signal transduction histidine kinase/CheY-like chemotaxis protein